VHAHDYTGENTIERELALVKIRCTPHERTELMQISHVFGAVIQDLSETSMIIQATGSSDKLDGLHQMLSKYTILEMVRTGKVLMARGDQTTG